MSIKPLGKKAYGSIAHLPSSRMGPADHHISEGQARIATEKVRDKHDRVIVQEKLDGSNVSVANIYGEIVPLTRAGYLATSSPFEQHHMFSDWVSRNLSRFKSILNPGARICGEWLMVAHGTRYELPHEPFVAFDIFDKDNERLCYIEFETICRFEDLVIPKLLHYGNSSLSVKNALSYLNWYGHHGAKEGVEGAVWRVERKGKVDFLCKYVRPDKIDGKYFGDLQVMNSWTPRKAA